MKKIVIIALVGAALLGRLALHYVASGATDKLEWIANVYQDGDYERALTEINRYLEERPRHALAWTIKGNILAEMDRDDDAEPAYLKAIEINPGAFQAINALGVMHRRRGDYDAAMEFYQRALKLKPGYAQALSSMAVIEIKRTNDVAAVRYAREAHANDQEDPVVAANLAVACHYAGEIEERDKYRRVTEGLGYENIDALDEIFAGEWSIRD